jgi:ribosomal protein L11 methyltransferase
LQAAARALGLEPRVSRLEAAAWQTPWTEYLRPVRVSDGFVLQPTTDDSEAPEGVTVLRFQPDLVFGVGSHATTRLAAAALERHIRPEREVLDVGTGTGVLAMIAQAAGARGSLGIDVDRRAVQNARENARLNGLSCSCRFSTRPLASVKRRYPLVVANVEAPALFELGPDLVRVTASTLIVTGVLAERRDELCAALTGLELSAETEDEGWILLELGRR